MASPPSVSYNLTISLLSSAGQFALEKPLETALLLSLGGVGCVVVNQWHSSPHQNTHNMANVLDSRFWTCVRNNNDFSTFFITYCQLNTL